MDYTYTLTTSPSTIVRSDGLHIPADPANVDYTAYLNWLADGNTPSPVSQADLAQYIAQLANLIDSAVASVYSNWTRFQQEYLLRQQAAQAYANAGYTGDPGIWVTSFSNAAGISAQQGAQLILQQAQALNGALAALAAQRMRKYELNGATDPATARATYTNILGDIQSIASQIK